MKWKTAFVNFTEHPLGVALVLIVLGFACYGIVLNGPFLFDDEHFIQKNAYVKDANIAKIFTTSVTEGADIEGNFYRPLQQTIYAGLYALFGETPVPFHLLQVLIHIGNAFLLWMLLIRLNLPYAGALAGAALFLCHPVQTEAVSYISGLAGPLGFLFVLSAIHTIIRASKRSSFARQILWLLVSFLLFILALFSKENTVVLIPLLILIGLYWRAQGKKLPIQTALATLLPIMLIAGIYVAIRFTIFDFAPDVAGLTEQKNLYTNNLWVRLTTFITIISEYLRLLLFPKDLFYEKQYVAYTTLLSWKALPGILLVLSTSASLLVLIIAKKGRTLALGLGWFMASLAPYSGIVPLNAMYLEHWLYIPMAGVAFLIGSLFSLPKRYNFRLVLAGVICVAVIALSARTIARNTEWADYEQFYLNELDYTSRSVRIYNNLAMYYSDKQNFPKAIHYYKKAIQSNNRYAQPHHNLARIYLEQGKRDKALREYRKALYINPHFVYTWHDLYKFFKENGNTQRTAKIQQLIKRVQAEKPISKKDIDAVLPINAE